MIRTTPCALLVACTYIFEPPDLPDAEGGEPDSGLPTPPLSGTPTEPLSGAVWSAGPVEDHNQFADSVASAGDINGDGYDDVMIGSYMSGSYYGDEGSASVFLGGPSGLGGALGGDTPDWSNQPDNQPFSGFGHSVASAGDVDGDSYDDVLVGAPYFNGRGDGVEEGKAYLYLGSGNGLPAEHDWFTESGQNEGHHGYSMASAGDVNDDGYADVVVGAPHYDDVPYEDVGKASVYFGGVGVWISEEEPDVPLMGTQPSAFFGWSVASAGDVDDDGYDDIVVGAPQYDAGHTNEGLILVYYGSPDGPQSSPTGIESNHAHSGFGYSVASAGDVDDDCFADVIVGAPNFDREGRAFLYHGSDYGLLPKTEWTGDPNVPDAEYGTAVASAGDVNDDGYADVVVGAPGNAEVAGKVYVHLGSDLGLSESATWTAEPEQGDSRFGATVAAAGHVNDDNYGDLVIGAPTHQSSFDIGKAFVYYGQCYDPSSDVDEDGIGDACDPCFGDNARGDGDTDGICGPDADSESPEPGAARDRGCNGGWDGGRSAGSVMLAALALLLTRSAPARTSAPSPRNTTRRDRPSPRARTSWPCRRPRTA